MRARQFGRIVNIHLGMVKSAALADGLLKRRPGRPYGVFQGASLEVVRHNVTIQQLFYPSVSLPTLAYYMTAPTGQAQE